MNTQRISFLSGLTMGAVATMCLLALDAPSAGTTAAPKVVPSAVSTDRPAPVAMPDPVMFVELEETRLELREMMQTLHDVAMTIGHSETIVGSLQFIDTLDSMPDEHLIDFVPLRGELASLTRQLATMRDLIAVEAAASGRTGSGDTGWIPASRSDLNSSPINGTLLAAPWDDPVYFAGPNRPPGELTLIAAGIKRVAWIVKRTADAPCGTVTVILGTGGNYVRPVCIATDVILALADAALEYLGFFRGAVDLVEIEWTFDQLAFLHDDLGDMLSALQAVLVKVDDLALQNEELRATNCELVRLLQLPQEQRELEVPFCPGVDRWTR